MKIAHSKKNYSKLRQRSPQNIADKQSAENLCETEHFPFEKKVLIRFEPASFAVPYLQASRTRDAKKFNSL